MKQLLNLDLSAKLCKMKRNQTNKQKVTVYQACEEDSNTIATVIRYIRKLKESKGQDGIANRDKEYSAIRKKVERAINAIKSDKFDINKVQENVSKEAQQILKLAKLVIEK